MGTCQRLLLGFTLITLTVSYDCNNGYCLPEAENLLSSIVAHRRRTLSVSSTCANASTYVKFPDTGDPTEFQCITEEHTKDYIYDLDTSFTTYWQSENSVSSLGVATEQWIVLSLTDVFSIRSVLIGFTSPRVSPHLLSDVRPKALAIERWLDAEQRFEAWRFYSSNCQSSFPLFPYQPINGPPRPPTVAVCKEQYYSGDVTTREPGKPYQFVLYSPFADFGDTYTVNETEQEYFSTAAVRIRLVEPAVQLELASYYSVSYLQVNGSCLCYGHADSCIGQNRADCDCIHNTQGANCQQCKPLYNAAPWQISADLQNSSCHRCDCNNNADSCLYNETAQEAVCVGCYGNSFGSRCENCLEGYYNVGPADGNTICTECQCHGEGVLNASLTCDSFSGQCACKSQVTGRSCDQCKDGYWNLTLDSFTGCQACDHCNAAGSVGTLQPICDKIVGECRCKANVMGQSCSMCKPQTYNLSRDNAEGCTQCGCIVGASLNQSCEYSDDYSCSCIDNVGGRMCDTPTPGYFVPKLDYIQIDTAINTQLSVPATGSYIVISSPVIEGSIYTEDYITAGAAAQQIYNNSTVWLQSNVTYKFNSSVAALLTLIPTSPLLNSSDGQLCLRQVMAGQSARSDICDVIEYSAMSSVYKTATECECDGRGSYTPHLCDPYGGQCYCKPGVTGRACDSCRASHFNFSTSGCTACDCHPHGSVELSCDRLTGACVCHPNITGDRCQSCVNEHYGLNSGSGCRRCQCTQYALDNNCDDAGVCSCSTGVEGDTCTRCQHGYYSLSVSGCLPCNCSHIGSVNSTCTTPAAICMCQPFVHGDNCDMCLPGFHRLWQAGKPCKMCYCSGHSLQCSTQPGWSKVTVIDRWSLMNDSLLQPRWSVVDSGSRVQPTSPQLYHGIADVQEVTVFTVANASISSVYYYTAPEKYLGDLRATYYQLLNFTLSCKFVSSNVLERRLVLRSYGLHYELLSVPLAPPGEAPTHYSLRLAEYNFIRNNTLRTATLPSLLLLLSNVTAVLIPANYDSLPNSTCTLYDVAMESGVRDFTSGMQELSNVEQCVCPNGYEGGQCQRCADGYTRYPAGSESPTSQCIPCDCSGRSCDPMTGVCYCTGSTTGARCESCLSDYYGIPSSGGSCLPCTCYGTTNSSCVMEVDQMPTCLACNSGYSGRQCQVCALGYFGDPPAGVDCAPCNCNGHSIECDALTGVCTGCQANTGGDYCETCVSGFYSNGSNNCIECACPDTGYDRVCHPETGACQCLSGLDMSSDCNSCLQAFYNLSTSGCLPCACNAAGSTDTRCNVTTGQCSCIAGVVGRDCSVCTSGYYNSSDGCVACNCNTEGAISTTACDPVTGKCACRNESIGGRTCDMCLHNTQGDFPACHPCGECYDGWRQLLTELSSKLDLIFYELRNISLQYGNLTSAEIQRTLGIIQQNISLSHDLYTTASRLINATSDVKLSVLLLSSSLDEVALYADILSNQQLTHADMLADLVSTFENATRSALSDVEVKLYFTSATKGQIDRLMLDFEQRLNTTIHNLTSLQRTNEMLRLAASDAMEELSAVNASLTKNDSSIVSHLLRALDNSTIQLLSDDTTLSILSTALGRRSEELDAAVMLIYNASESLSLLRPSVLAAYEAAYKEMVELDSLSTSAMNCRQRMEQLLSTVSQHVATVEALRLELDKQWLELNQTEQIVVDTNLTLNRMSQLTLNISNTSLPNLQLIESLMVSIKEIQLNQKDIDRMHNLLDLAVMSADEYSNDTLSAESEIATVVEQVESALRDVAAADSYLDRTSGLVNENIALLQSGIRQTLSEVNSSLEANALQTTQVLSQLDLFYYLTNQIRECSVNSTHDLLYLNVSAAEARDDALQNEQVMSDTAAAQSQLFLRLQMQAAAAQSAQIRIDESAEAQSGTIERLADKRQQVMDLLVKYRENEQRLSQVEQEVEETEARLLSLIDSYRYPTESHCGN